MYSIDINFLRDRKLDSQTSGTSFKKEATPMSERVPIFIGVGVAVALIGLAGGALLVLNNQKATIQKQIAELELKINQLQQQNVEVQKIESEITNISQETEALVSVFKNIKPWSALLAEISVIIPPNVQIQSISQSEGKTLNIRGIASSYDDVNDFVLTLKSSKFLNSEKTQLNSTNLRDHPQSTSGAKEDDQPLIQWPKVMNYDITTELSEIPASELINDLKSRGAIGLITRMKTLEQKGAIKQ
jgi:type IV pilus assembly protein PilN